MNDEEEKEWFSCRETSRLLGVSTQTLRNWSQKGRITSIRNPSGQNLYNKKDINNILGRSNVFKEKRKVCYIRVSSKKQMDDFQR